MPRLTRDCLDDIRLRADIVDVCGQVVRLTRAGSEWKGLSPFTTEKTPSFYVIPNKAMFYCFSSGTGGDVFKFVMLTEKLEFYEAAVALAERYQVELRHEDGAAPRGPSRSLKQALRDMHSYAADFFHAALKSDREDAAAVRLYWEEKRNFPLGVAEEFSIGYAPPDGGKLKERLLKKGFEPEALKQSGLFHAPDYRPDPRDWHPRFRGRLMIPIRDATGQVIAFTARQLAQTPESDPAHAAKYVNSPTTPLFEKRQMLFNLDRARKAVDETGAFTLVEGQLDAVRCWHAGVKAAVAPQGSAVTSEQMMLLKRYATRLEVVLDGDRAGRNAALKVLPLALAAELDVRFIPLAEGTDPDDFLAAHGLAGWEGLRSQALGAMEFAAGAVLPQGAEASPRERANALLQVCELLSSCESETARLGYLDEAIDALRLDRRAARADAAQFFDRRAKRDARRTAPGAPAPPGAVPPPAQPAVIPVGSVAFRFLRPEEKEAHKAGRARVSGLTPPEHDLLWLVLHDDRWGSEWLNACPGLAAWCGSSTEGRLLARFLSLVEAGEFDPRNLEPHLESEKEQNVAYRLLATPLPDHVSPPSLASARLHALQQQFLREQIAVCKERLPSASGGVPASILSDLQNLKRTLLAARPPELSPLPPT